MKKLLIIAITVFMASALYIGSAFADRDATPEERAQVVEALSAVGCPEVGEVEFDDGYFEADDVKCDDGVEYEIHLDKNMNIIKKKIDD